MGLIFWIGLTLIGSALPVRLPHGTVVSVSAAPFLASLVLGGPLAAAIVAAVGTTDPREVRRQIPWYGTLYNHAAVVLSVIVGGATFELARIASTSIASPHSEVVAFLGLVVGSGVYYFFNAVLALMAVSARTGTSFRTIWAQDLGAITTSLLGLVPLAWLMAQIFLLPNGVGWWATPLFVVPLFTTRLAYHRYVETRELFEQTIGALAAAVDARDRYTAGHSARVSHIAEAMCRALKLPEGEIEKIKWAGLLHDVGKIGIRDHILLKEGPLDKEERILMNQHPSIGADIVEPARQLSDEAPLIRAHHEWFNGSGYPDGIEALDIPDGARLLSVADAYEAMTSARPYRKTPLSHEIAIGELTKYTGIQFDPQMVEVFLGLDRETLDWRPARADPLPHEQPAGPTDAGVDEGADEGADEGGDDGDASADDAAPADDPKAAAAPTPEAQEGTQPSRPQLASDDVS